MSINGAGPAPNQRVLTGVSNRSPSLAGYPFFGTTAAWSGDDGKIWLATDQSDPPFQPQVVNPHWKTFEPPAIAMSLERGVVYLAWTDPEGNVRIANSGDGWGSDLSIGLAQGGPALLILPGRICLAYNYGNQLQLTYTDLGITGISDIGTGLAIYSRPTLALSGNRLYALSGGSSEGQGDQSMRVYASDDDGQTFGPVGTQAIRTLGPPSLAFVNDKFHLVWADGETAKLCHAVTPSLSQFSVTQYSDGCHFGGPSICGMPDGVTIGWSYGAPPENQNAHHITLARLPLDDGAAELQQIENALSANDKRRAQADPQCYPGDIYNPATKQCVARGGCWGGCVSRSFGVWGFNPFSYAACVIACKVHTSGDSDDDDEGSDKRRSD